jgi:hypothetical protein
MGNFSYSMNNKEFSETQTFWNGSGQQKFTFMPIKEFADKLQR